jgi:hypothetical protein
VDARPRPLGGHALSFEGVLTLAARAMMSYSSMDARAHPLPVRRDPPYCNCRPGVSKRRPWVDPLYAGSSQRGADMTDPALGVFGGPELTQ